MFLKNIFITKFAVILRNRFYTLFFLLVLVILLLELSLRFVGFGSAPVVVMDEKVEYYLEPNKQFSRWGNSINTNRYGMRSEDFDKKNDFYHISILGDSIVYGNHFIDQDETIAFQLKKSIANKHSSIVSAIAASSWGPQNIYAYYEKFGPFQGDLAILVQSSHDMYDVPFQSPFVIPYKTHDDVFAIVDLVDTVISRLRRSYILNKGESDKTPEDKLQETSQSLSRLIESLKKNYKAVVLVHHLQKNELTDTQSLAINHFKSIAASADIKYLSTKDIYKQKNEMNSIYRDHIHLNAYGVKVLSEFISTHPTIKEYFSQ